MKAVFDTVILVRALINPFSPWGQLIFDYADTYVLIVSPEIVAEYFDVVRRPELVRKFHSVAGRDIAAILAIVAKATFVQPLTTPAVCRDPADDKFLAAATAGDVSYIVTEDNDLLDLSAYETISIVTSEAFMQIIAENTGSPG